MIRALLFDFSRTLIFPKDAAYTEGNLNPLHESLKAKNPDYPFLDYFELNHALLAYLKTLKNRFKVCIFTTGYIQEAPQIQDDLAFFDGIYSAEKMGSSKTNPEAYLQLAEKIGFRANEILFV